MSHIIWPDDPAATDRIGGKAQALAAMRLAGSSVPDWFVLEPNAFVASGGSLDPGLVGPSATICQALAQALATLCPNGEQVAVRSSALDEDGPQRSFAGQYDSFLAVPPDQVPERIAQVWRSGTGERVRGYRIEHGLSPDPRPPAVLIQRMVDADSAGVAFSADPVSGRRGIAVVEAVSGLGTALVSGACEADRFLIDRNARIESRSVAHKTTEHRPNKGEADGTVALPIAVERSGQATLSDDQARAVAALARQAERVFGRPQDIEWAIEAGRLWLLQARPITSLAERPDPDGARLLWDNSNIAESYGGVTTPLTFSFALHAYEQVYRQLCRVLRAPPRLIAAHDQTFKHMLGLIQGRIYYNLLNWYRLLALLPGFAVNRRFMEGMMGVREGLPPEICATLGTAGWGHRLRDATRLLLALCSLLAGYLLLPRRVRRFHRRIDDALGEGESRVHVMRADELAAEYQALERSLITRWDTPLLNDLCTMIFFGLLRSLTTRWCHDQSGTLQNDLVRGAGDMISAEPVARIHSMAAAARIHPGLVEALCEGTLATIECAVEEAPGFRAQYQAYLDRFADRCLDELKLESPTLRDDPLILLRAVGRLAAGSQSDLGEVKSAQGSESAAEVIHAALRGHPVRHLIFGWVLRGARARVRDRENLRFERTRVFGRVRQIFVELGRRFHTDGLLDDPRDVFYLEVQEILGYVDGTATCTDLRGLAALRRAEFERFQQLEAPPDRFETHGCVYLGNGFATTAPTQAVTGQTQQGLGCCQGVVRGPVRIVVDPSRASIQQGEILVAERTNPGWVLLFPAAAGVLVERGSLLSHAAIVARELGVPTIVCLQGATRWLRDGDWIEMDGSSGSVTLLSTPAMPVAPRVAEPEREPSHV